MRKLIYIFFSVSFYIIYNNNVIASNKTFNQTPPIPKSENVTQLKINPPAVQTISTNSNNQPTTSLNISENISDKTEKQNRKNESSSNKNELITKFSSSEYTKNELEKLKQTIQDPFIELNYSDGIINIFNVLVKKVISDHMTNKAIRDALINMGLRVVTLPGGEKIKATADSITPKKTEKQEKVTTLYKVNVIMPSEHCEKMSNSYK